MRIFLTLVLVAVIIWQLGGVGEIWRELTDINAPRYLLLFFLIVTFDRVLMAFKWTLLLRGRGMHLPFFQALVIYGASTVWGLFLPSTMGADAVRILNTSRAGVNTDEVVASVAMERMLGFLSALLLGLFSLILLSSSNHLNERYDFLWWLGGSGILGALLAFSVSFSRRFYEWLHHSALRRFRGNRIVDRLERFHHTYLAYRDSRGTLIVFFALTLLEQLLPILDTWVMARALDVNAGFWMIASVLPLALLLTRVPVSIDGIGVLEGVFAALMSLGGVPPAQSIAMALAGRLMLTVALLPWWLLHLLGHGRPKSVPPGPDDHRRSLLA